MSDKLLLADDSTSDNATGEEFKCLTCYRNLDECPTKQQAGNRVHVWDYGREADCLMRMYSVNNHKYCGSVQPCFSPI